MLHHQISQRAERYAAPFCDYAYFFRELALSIDADPSTLQSYYSHPALQFLLQDRFSTTLMRTQYLEALAYGDPGVVLACPGPSLAGLMIRELGLPDEIDYFYNFLKTHQAQTFFALTEPERGSDATALSAELIPTTKGQYILRGEKCLVGNAAIGKIGIVIARTHVGPLGIRAVLITEDLLNSYYIERYTLPMAGLRGAQIGFMQFHDCPIPAENLLGKQLRPMQHGMLAVLKTFNRLRTGVGALALGQAQAVVDFFAEHKKQLTYDQQHFWQTANLQVSAARQLLAKAAAMVDIDANETYAISLAKVNATQLTETIINDCIEKIEPQLFLENQWLQKCFRDCFTWEFMEGTTHMQYNNIYQHFEKTQRLG